MCAFATMENDLQGLQTWLPTLTPARLRDDTSLLQAVSAVSAAALETRKYLARYRFVGATPHRGQSKLVNLWREAGLALIRVDQSLASRCLLKADYWADPSNWDSQRINESSITLDGVFEASLKLVNLAASPSISQETSVIPNRVFREEDLTRVTIGILTALPKEIAAVKKVLNNGNEVIRSGTGSGRRYWIAQVPSSDGKVHVVAATQMVSMGNNMGGSRATQLLEHCPNASEIIMVGIAGGVPNAKRPDEHVRLGDIVVSNAMGTIQYDLVKRTGQFEQPRNPPRAPSAILIEVLNALEATELEGSRPWDRYAAQAIASLGWNRPEPSDDVLKTPGGRKVIPHPDDPERRPDSPKIYRGPIASSNKLLKDPDLRDKLRDQFGVKAVEMEASGVADAAWLHGRGYLVVRGICDYCDKSKGDAWQKYASVIAAAYALSILEHLPAASHQGSQSPHQSPPPSTHDGAKLRGLVHELDTRRIFYEIEENFGHAVSSVLDVREEIRRIASGLWQDSEAEGWANEIMFLLGDFLSRVGDPGSGQFNYQGFYRQVDAMRLSVNRVVLRILRKYPNIRVRNLQIN